MATVVKDLGAVTAYAYAVAGGYSGTEAEFEALLGNIAEDLSEIENLSVTVTTLPAGSSATASYSNGVLSLGIPKGDKGDKGDTGATGATGPQGIPGDVANLAPAYSTSSTYGVGDYCIYNSQLYRCTSAITTAELWTAAHWTAVALGDDVSDLKSALDTIEDVLEIEQTEWTGSATHESSTSTPFTTLIDGISLENGVSYTFTVSIPSAISTTVYLYLKDSSNNNIQTNSIATGDTSKSKTFTAAANYSNVSLQFAVPMANVTATAVFTKNVDSRNALEKLDDSVEEIEEYISDIKDVRQYGNIYSQATDAITGKYYYRNTSTGKLANASNASYDGFIVKVVPHSIYTFVKSDIVLLDKNKDPLTGAESWDYRAVESCDSGNAEYFAVSVDTSNVPQAGYAISQGTGVSYETYSEEIYAKAYQSKSSFTAKITGNIAANGSLTLDGRTAIKDGQAIIFKADISDFSKLTLNFVDGSNNVTNYVEVDSTTIKVKNGSGDPVSITHGLTIGTDFTLLCELKDGQIIISVASLGVTYKADAIGWSQNNAQVTKSQIKSTATVCTNATLSNVYYGASRKIWYFGDSYINFGTDTRLPFYAHQYGLDKNILFSGAAGATTISGRIAFSTLLQYGKPYFAVFSLGMNNGSDSSSAPQSQWQNAVENFIALCESYKVTPVLCTVPTVPSVDNEQKNAYVRASGYRYIDYAAAVGADSDGHWYGYGTANNMLSNDNVHPSSIGANALFTQMLKDLPEVFLGS